MSQQKILVTGGAGFIGSHLAEKYVKEGHTVRVLDDFSGGEVGNIRGLFNHRNFKLVKGDIRDFNMVKEASSRVDTIFNLAAQIHVDRSIINPKETFETNAMGTLHVLEAALANDTKKIVHVSSSEVYGSAQYAPMDETHALNPGSPYAASKAAADRLCYSYYATYGLPVTIVRPFNTFGPRQRSTGYGGAISIFIDRALKGLSPVIYGDGKQTRDYSYIADTVQGLDLVFHSTEDLFGMAINLGSGSEISILDLARKIVSLCGQEGKIEPVFVDPRPGEVLRLQADTKLAKTRLGFSPKYTIDRGLREFIDWHKRYKHEEWVKTG